MKTRVGFVSNSSSASYIVKLDMRKEDFYEWFASHVGHKYDTIIKLNKRIKLCEDTAKELEEEKFDNFSGEEREKKERWHSYEVERNNEWLSHSKHVLKKLEDAGDDVQEWVPIILEHNMIFVTATPSGCTKLLSTTSMHNDYNDMGELLKELVITFAFEGRCKMDCEMHDEQYTW